MQHGCNGDGDRGGDAMLVPPTAIDPLAQYSVALLLSYSLSLFCGGWLSSSPTRSLSLVEGGAWEGEESPGPGPGGAKRPFWQARITRRRTRRRIRTGRLGSAWGVVRDVTVVGEVPAPACGQCDRCL
jgi:hypothetical protein